MPATFKLLVLAFVSAMPREGFPGIYRAGRLWPGGKQVEVEVYDCAEDPAQEEGRPIMLGQKSFALLHDDPRISVKQERAKDALEAQVENERLVAELAEAKKAHEELASGVMDLATKAAAIQEEHDKLKAEHAKLQAENAKLQAELKAKAKVEADAKEAATKAGK